MDTTVGIIFLTILVSGIVHGNITATSRNTLYHTASMSIYDGTKVSVNKHPYMVVIQVEKSRFCTGTIVSDSWVLTTADCVQDKGVSMHVLMRRRYNKVKKVKNVVIHPAYPSGVYDFDFACVQIKGKFHFAKKVQPARLPLHSPNPGSTVVAVGWSAMRKSLQTLSSKHKSAEELVEGWMTWLPEATCNSTLGQMGIAYSDTKACAFHRNKTTLCTGAWGAPVVRDGVVYGQFVGVAADGICSSSASPVILSDISAVSSWVHQVTGAMVE